MMAALLRCAAALCGLCCALSRAQRCPPNCLCDATTIDCSSNKLSAMPHIQPRSPALVVNFSANSLTSLDTEQSFPASQTTLDLSFNRISSVPANVFGGEGFVGLHALNLSGNLIAEVRFVFPSSLRVLRLGRNEIQHFGAERLKSLSQLQTLSLEQNGLRTLTCEERRGPERKAGTQEECCFQPFQRIREIFLQGNELKALDYAAFRCFQNTHFLSLADNSIESLPATLFRTFQKLKYLDLSGNRLAHIAEAVFYRLPSLKFLSLSRNRLPAVPAMLPMLEWLDLSHNAIASIPEAQKSDLYPQVKTWTILVVVSSRVYVVHRQLARLVCLLSV